MSSERSVPFDAAGARRLLDRELDGIDGWLDPLEAWHLHEAARQRAAVHGTAYVVEIGSWLGRSAIALGRGVTAGGAGVVHAIDPHEDADDRHAEFLRNLDGAGLASVVRPVRLRSHDARPSIEDGSIDVLFVDGSHEYDDVLTDIDDWTSALRPGAVVAFNDPWLPGVARALRHRVVRGSAFREPRVIVNTLFCEFREGSPTSEDERSARRLGRLLRFGSIWLRLHHRIVFNERIPMKVKVWNVKVAVACFRRLLPTYEPSEGPIGASPPPSEIES